MAEFYGVVQGNRGSATRTGSKVSGLRTIASSWVGAIEVELQCDDQGQIHATVTQMPWQGTGPKREVVYSTIFNPVPKEQTNISEK